MNMNNQHQLLLHALVAAQVAVFEHLDEDINSPPKAIDSIDKHLKEAVRLAKIIRKDCGE